jgi:putative methionine-R-sulfoxide reductase with GAF domain
VAEPASPGPSGDRLRDIQSVSDAELSRLDDHDFLAELLDRIKAILDADIAAALLVDYSSGHLVATASAGLEEEVRQGVRIPVGRGFAGRIAAERKPVILNRVDHTTVLNPILLARGISSLMGVPMVAGQRVIGVLYVGSLSFRRFTSSDVELLQLAANRAAVAVQSMQTRQDRVAVTALQRSLLPSRLPAMAGAELSARYIPGHGVVGGDWYDVFILPSGELGLVIGDVAGSGLPAAVIMGRMRSALRAYALQPPLPPDPRHPDDRHQEFLKFLRQVARAYPRVDHDRQTSQRPDPGSTAPERSQWSSPRSRRRLCCRPPRLPASALPNLATPSSVMDCTRLARLGTRLLAAEWAYAEMAKRTDARRRPVC